MKVADKGRLGYVGSKPGARDSGRDSDSWFTYTGDNRLRFTPWSSIHQVCENATSGEHVDA